MTIALGWGMARIRRSTRHRSQFVRTLLGGSLALTLVAAPASAELSSVDAYGGQAQVLGKPVHRHRTVAGSPGGAGSRSGQGSGASGSEADARATAKPSSGPGSHEGSGATAPTRSGSSTASNGTAGTGSSAGREGDAGARHGGEGAKGAVAVGISGASGGQQSGPIAAENLADVSNGSLSLSALDVLLLVVIFAGLAGVCVLIRRWSRQSA
jgi:hypothetical protein